MCLLQQASKTVLYKRSVVESMFLYNFCIATKTPKFFLRWNWKLSNDTQFPVVSTEGTNCLTRQLCECYQILSDLDVGSICVHICEVGSGFIGCVVWICLFLLVTVSVVKWQMQQ